MDKILKVEFTDKKQYLTSLYNIPLTNVEYLKSYIKTNIIDCFKKTMSETKNNDILIKLMEHYIKVIESLNEIEVITKIEMFVRYYIYNEFEKTLSHFKTYDKIENDKIIIRYYLN